MPSIEFVCMANSRKHAGRCVAGIRTDGGGWIRPVSPLDDTLYPVHYTLDEGTEARPLDLLRADLTGAAPQPHHPEDWLLGEVPWQLLSRPAPRDVIPHLRDQLVRDRLLFGTADDRVPYRECQARAGGSLALVHPQGLCWCVQIGRDGRRRHRAQFSVPGMPGVEYRLSITDPLWDQRLAGLQPGEVYPRAAAGLQDTERVVLTISLGEPFADGCCYKLVAAVIVVPRWG